MARTVDRVLITGAQGFVGRHLCATVLSDNPNALVLGVGRSVEAGTFTHSVRWGERSIPAPLPDYLRNTQTSSRYCYVSTDLGAESTITRLITDFRPDAIVHLASGLSGADARLLFRTNVEGTIALLEAVHGSAHRPLVILGSTGGVYGVAHGERLPFGESADCRPVDMYSASKLAAEHAATILASRLGIPVVSARIFNLVGPGQQEQHVCGRIMSQCAAILDGCHPSVVTVGDLETTRDMIDVRDAARALHCLARNATAGHIYNVGSGTEVRIGQILDDILGLAGLKDSVEIRSICDRRPLVPRHFADVTRIRALGFETCITLRDSLSDVLDYYRRDVARAAQSEGPDGAA